MRPAPTAAFVILLGVWPLVFGCGRGHQLDTAPVQGRITLDGQPVPKGSVVFSPEKGRGAMGILREDGTYTLSTYGEGDGAVMGKHTVTVISNEPVPGLDPDDIDTPIRWLVPRRYTDPSTSGLQFEIEPGKVNEANFALTRSE